jgi:ABC-type amino acid transport substrate-binding protein
MLARASDAGYGPALRTRRIDARSVLVTTTGVLRIGAALPDPPFELMEDGKPAGFDIELTQAIASDLALEWRLVPFQGVDFNGIFDLLSTKAVDCIASGATITPQRQRLATFCEPYIRSGQSLVCNIEATPNVRSIDDLHGMVLGVQQGNTSEPVAQKLKADGRIAEVRIYAYHDIGKMLDALEAGCIGAVMKLAPVMHWFVRGRPRLRVVQENITDESLAIAVALGNESLRRTIDAAQARLRDNGTLSRLTKKWLTP